MHFMHTVRGQRANTPDQHFSQYFVSLYSLSLNLVEVNIIFHPFGVVKLLTDCVMVPTKSTGPHSIQSHVMAT